MRRIGSSTPWIGGPTKAAPLTVMLLALACAACSKPEAASRGPSTNSPVVVVTAGARMEPLGVDIEAVGTTLANESVQLTSKAPNTITAIRFAEGSEVARGAVLVEMEDAEEQAALAEAQAALVDSQSQYNRSRDLLARQALSVAELDQLEATLKANQARVAAAQARLDDTVIRAPFNGSTGFRRVSVGQLRRRGHVDHDARRHFGDQARLHGAGDLHVRDPPRACR